MEASSLGMNRGPQLTSSESAGLEPEAGLDESFTASVARADVRVLAFEARERPFLVGAFEAQAVGSSPDPCVERRGLRSSRDREVARPLGSPSHAEPMGQGFQMNLSITTHREPAEGDRRARSPEGARPRWRDCTGWQASSRARIHPDFEESLRLRDENRLDYRILGGDGSHFAMDDPQSTDRIRRSWIARHPSPTPSRPENLER